MSIHEIRVSENHSDPRAHAVERRAGHEGLEVDLESGRVFYLEGVTDEQADLIANELLSDPVTQTYRVGKRTDWDNPNKVDVSPLPGTTNPEASSIVSGSKLLGINADAASSGVEYTFSSATEPSIRDQVVSNILVNKTVEQVRTESPRSLIIEGARQPIEELDIGHMDDMDLFLLSQDWKAALNLGEMQSIKKEAIRLNRKIKDCELKYLGAAWSEHCCHKTTNANIVRDGELVPSVFSRIKNNSTPFFEEREVLTAFVGNSGAWRFYNGEAINIKLETHNSPKNIEPEGGSATGTGGVLRDINETGRGARPINSMHMDFIADPDIADEDVPPGALTPRQLLIGAVAGVAGYGNPLGVPTNNGSLHIHPNYRGKSSILVGSMGIMHESNTEYVYPEFGDLVVAVGGRTGIDGINGATFSSVSADAETATIHAGAVQKGDPITEKKMFDAIEEASELGLIRAMTDCGAAGFASAIGELGEDIGVKVDLAKAPLKYTGLKPWEIFLSESQERAVLAVDPNRIQELFEVFAKHDSEATVLGNFGTIDGEPKLEVLYDGESLVDLEYNFIKNGRETLTLEANWTPPEIEEIDPELCSWEDAWEAVLSDWNVCSKEPIVRRYDHEVQGTSAMKSYAGVHNDAPNNAAVMTPILGEPYAVIQSHGCNPALTELDPSLGSTWSYAEAMSNFVAVGGNPNDAVIVNNYISGSPTPRIMGALDKSVDALVECVKEFRSPIISGKDSLSSTYKHPDGTIIESPYNLIITVAGKIPDVEKTVSSDIKKPGSTLVLVGKPDYKHLGGSVFYDNFGGSSKDIPEIDVSVFHQTCTSLFDAIQTGKVLSAHDVSEGGIAVTISEMLFGGDCGAYLNIRDNYNELENILFNETAGCFVVEIEDENQVQELFGDVPHQVLGRTKVDKTINVSYNGSFLPPLSVDNLKDKWKQPLQELLA